MPSRRRTRVLAALAAVTGAAGLLAGCSGGGDSSNSDRATTTTATNPPVSATTPPNTRPVPTTTTVQVAGVRATKLQGLHGRVVCELDVVHNVSGKIVADVYTTAGLDDCDTEAFSSIDTKVVAVGQQASLVLRNGPRVWVLDDLATTVDTQGRTIDAGGLTFQRSATVDVDAVRSQQPYTPYTLDRAAIAVFQQGTRVYELRAPNGDTWVMQTFSTHLLPELTEDHLPALGDQLRLPNGWTYSSRVLDDDLRVGTAKPTVRALQDNLLNSYLREGD